MKRLSVILTIILVISMISCQQAKKENENKMPDQQAEVLFPKGNKITSDNFTGTVWLQMMIDNDSTLYAKMGNITFEPKARTNWHVHPGGQILIITNGVGYYQEKGKPAQLLRKGEFVEIPPNVVHWHGAAPDNEFAHIAISLNTDEGGVIWLQPVTDEEYSLSTK
jgi:quercetin dioxygenase-like cupin family protein